MARQSRLQVDSFVLDTVPRGKSLPVPGENPTVLRGKKPLYSEGNALYFKGSNTVPQGKKHCTRREEPLYLKGKKLMFNRRNLNQLQGI